MFNFWGDDDKTDAGYAGCEGECECGRFHKR